MASSKIKKCECCAYHPGQEVLPGLLGSQITAASDKQASSFPSCERTPICFCSRKILTTQWIEMRANKTIENSTMWKLSAFTSHQCQWAWDWTVLLPCKWDGHKFCFESRQVWGCSTTSLGCIHKHQPLTPAGSDPILILPIPTTYW
jgi:hypothetical protein